MNKKLAISMAALLLAAGCGGGSQPPTPSETAKTVSAAMEMLEGAKFALTRTYVDKSYVQNSSGETTVPITWYRPEHPHIKGVGYQIFSADAVIEMVPMTGSGNAAIDGKMIGIFGTGHPDGTVTWICGTAIPGVHAPAGDAIMYPYLPPDCQH